jgi:GNAT superfamily N-acetyltransferase
VEIRRARLADAAAIAEVHVRTWQAAYEHIFGAERLATLDLGRRIANWERWLAEPEPRESVSVAVDDGVVVAFSYIGESHERADEGELYAIYALPTAWGTGAGPELMRAAAGALREAGFLAAVLWVLEDNPRARRFYEREGWSLDGGHREGEHLGVATVEVRYRITF